MGTGAVHTAPTHGPEDYALGVQYQLPLRTIVDKKRRYHHNDSCPTPINLY